MKVLVIGGTGFIGFHVVHSLINNGHEARVLALPPTPEGLALPAEVSVVEANLNLLPDEECIRLLSGYKAFVFAAGADDRTVPDRPALPFFMDANVKPLVRLISLSRKAGLEAGIVMGSYFTHFNRIWPEMKLAERHPYIQSRAEQQRQGFEAAGPDFRLMFLELPFIFGSVPGRQPLWTPLVRYLESGWPVFCPEGGTAVVSVKTVATAAAAALERGKAQQCYPLGEENLTWNELFARLSPTEGKKVRLRFLPAWLLESALALFGFYHRIKGKEGGLHTRYLPDILLKNTFLSAQESPILLNYRAAGMDEAFQETLESARKSF